MNGWIMSYSSHSRHLTYVVVCRHTVNAEPAKGLGRWYVQRRTQLIYYAIIGARQSRPIFIRHAPTSVMHALLEIADTEIGSITTWYASSSQDGSNMLSYDRSQYNRLAARQFHCNRLTAVILFLLSLLAFNSTPLMQTLSCVCKSSMKGHSALSLPLHLPFLIISNNSEHYYIVPAMTTVINYHRSYT